MQIDCTDTSGNSVHLRIVPRDRKRYRRVEEHAEVERIVGVFPEVIAIENDPALDSLLEAGVEFVPIARPQGPRLRAEHVFRKTSAARSAGKDQVLVVWGLKRSRVRRSDDGIGDNLIRNSEPRLNAVGG